jgi:protein-disulfide isomerase
MSNERLTRDQQREAARAKAKAMREAQKKTEGRKKVAIVVASATVIVVALVAVVYGLFATQQNTIQQSEGPSTAIFDGGIKIGKDLKVITTKTTDPAVPNIILYEDLQCPACQAFEIRNLPQLRELVTAGKYTLEIHPISFLDGNSANEYSSRAGSAVLCVAESASDKFFDFNEALYKAQPAEGTAGQTNEQLAEIASKVGVTDSTTLDCITKAKWASWVKNKGSSIWTGNVPGTSLKFTGTPFVVVNGQQYQGDTTNAAMFLQWLQTVAPVSNN